jgi:hypothetical protein
MISPPALAPFDGVLLDCPVMIGSCKVHSLHPDYWLFIIFCGSLRDEERYKSFIVYCIGFNSLTDGQPDGGPDLPGFRWPQQTLIMSQIEGLCCIVAIINTPARALRSTQPKGVCND